MGAAYEAAKAGGKHEGMLRIYRELPDNLIEKAIRSLAALELTRTRGDYEFTLVLGGQFGPEPPMGIVRTVLRISY